MARLHSLETQSARYAIRRLPVAALAAGATSAAANALVFSLLKYGFGLPFSMPMAGPQAPPMPLNLGMVVVTSLVPAIGAGILLALLRRFVARPARAFKIIALAFLLVSLIPPWMIAPDAATSLGLSSMHVVAAGIIVEILGRARRKPSPGPVQAGRSPLSAPPVRETDIEPVPGRADR